MSEYRLTWDKVANTGYEARCRTHNMVLLTGLGAMGVGRMWSPSNQHDSQRADWDDLPERPCSECGNIPNLDVVGEGVFTTTADGLVTVSWHPPNAGRTLCTRAVIEAMVDAINSARATGTQPDLS